MKLVIANWKEYPANADEAVALARACDFSGLVLCPPHAFLDEVSVVIKNASLGAQDYAPDLSSRGVRYAIIGHSDRRRAGESDDIVAEKAALTLDDGIVPVICVGESRSERDRGNADRVIRDQVVSAIARISAHVQDFPASSVICLAYEPVWAISTAPGAAPASVSDAIHGISVVKEAMLHAHCPFVVRYLYGGSMTRESAGDFLASDDIGGLLVGGASRDSSHIKNIWQQSQKQQ